jgi:hypothetical protein
MAPASRQATLPLRGSKICRSWGPGPRYPSANAQPIRDFADQMQRFNQVHGTLMQAAKQSDMDMMKQVLANESPTF